MCVYTLHSKAVILLDALLLINLCDLLSGSNSRLCSPSNSISHTVSVMAAEHVGEPTGPSPPTSPCLLALWPTKEQVMIGSSWVCEEKRNKASRRGKTTK